MNVKIMAEDLRDVDTALRNLWNYLSLDAGGYSSTEKAELVLDRIAGTAGEDVDRLCNVFGWDAVVAQVADTIFGDN